MLTELQKKAAQAIVVLLETSDPRGDYSAVTVIPGDSGHLTYGRLQATLGSGSLHLLVDRYCAAPGAALADSLAEYLPHLKERDPALDRDQRLRELLADAGEDPVMRAVQDAFFDAEYWAPAVHAATRTGLESALGASIVFDGFMHDWWGHIRDIVNEQTGPPERAGEEAWLRRYIVARREWLGTHPRPDPRMTVYRMDAFRQVADAGNWTLALPFTVRGALIDEPLLVSGLRRLELRVPPMRGDDVRRLQRALTATGFPLRVDGMFGPRTADAVKRFQQARRLRTTGIVGPETRAALEI